MKGLLGLQGVVLVEHNDVLAEQVLLAPKGQRRCTSQARHFSWVLMVVDCVLSRLSNMELKRPKTITQSDHPVKGLFR